MFTNWFSASKKEPTKFKLQYSFEKRKELSEQVTSYNLSQSIRRIPLIIENDKDAPGIGNKIRHIVRENYTIGQIKSHVLMRMRDEMEKEGRLHEFPVHSGLHFMIGEYSCYLPSNTETIGSVYDKYADEDGFLYISYMMQNAYG